MSISFSPPCTKPLKLLAGTAAAALLIGWAAGVGAQTAIAQAPQQQASPPALALGHDDVREVQNQLIALGFDPGSADGQAGPATVAAAQQYDQKRGGKGQVSIDAEFLARLKADTGPRLSYEQVAARSQARSSAAAAPASSSASASNQLGNVVQQILPLVGAAISNSNSNNNNNYNGGYNNGGYYGPGYYGSRPGYYGPGPGYYGHGYGGY